MAKKPYIEIKNLSFSYPNQERKILDDVHLTIDKGDFVLVMGSSGSGKSTLLRQLKPKLAPSGRLSGDILIDGVAIEYLSDRKQAEKIGFVMQVPENQIVTDKVWHELAFSMENLGFPQSKIRTRVAEMASFFGMQEWFHKDIHELSGGQKQKLVLASIMTLNPEILLLDEPTSQLDPIAATEFFRMLEKIHQELGVTIVLIEHNIAEIMAMTTKLVTFDKGKVKQFNSVMAGIQWLKHCQHELFWNLPIPTQVWWCLDKHDNLPITIHQGKQWLDNYVKQNSLQHHEFLENPISKEYSIQLKDIWFRYAQDDEFILKGVTLNIPKNSIFSIVGGNGTGKSTLINVLGQLYFHERGNIYIHGKKITHHSKENILGKTLAILPQNPRALFTQKTVELELSDMGQSVENPFTQHIIQLCQLHHILQQHPFDLSGGEQQRVALAKLLLLNPDILLLDEPTKGFDGEFKQIFMRILKQLKQEQKTIVFVSHDLECVASIADQCALFFDGNIVSSGHTRQFFSHNQFYTTSGNLMARHTMPEAITAKDIVESIGGVFPELSEEQVVFGESKESDAHDEPLDEDTDWSLKKIFGIGSALLGFMLLTFYVSLDSKGIMEFLSGGSQANAIVSKPHVLIPYIIVIAGYMCCISVFFTLIAQQNKKQYRFEPLLKETPKMLRYRMFSILAVMMTVFWSSYVISRGQYYIALNLVVLEIFVPYVLTFEKRHWKTRHLVMISTFVAIAVAGRIAFFMLPQFKPMLAIVILAGVTLGSEVGFTVGALSALLSNMYFGQGPWTVWQMLAFALIGWLAGILYRYKVLSTNRIILSVFGGLSALLIYGPILNLSTVITVQHHLTVEIVIAAFVQGLPFDMIHAVATIFFMYIGADSMIEKIGRIREKYDI
ncbi:MULTISPECIES: energy-coupling factor transporter ATPase [unclassified Granulicatella]|uniref:energy-coupling factor transporter ATPase n=1 Tax=unclassified Granulicatella TaxID=2630493 RepID=UPI0014313745|nr:MULTISPECIES: energy-coupling factor transporter ATPase [unclassified Granulicatella]MBF0780908.1 ATP-binding cassette domain-containing protein [Granulicatella sp. 19428wC4_WM01]